VSFGAVGAGFGCQEADVDGTSFGRYRLIGLLGRGGMGEVWRAHDTETDRIVAIKLLPAALSSDEGFQQRFRREAHAAARLNNPHVIPIHHYGEIDGRLYVDMRLVEGRDFQTVLADGPLEPARAVRIVEQVARALHAAHQVGLIHRDVKPSNILLDGDDFAYLIDFGIARTIGETRMTTSGTVGTFQYIAPERLDDDAPEDARSDVYSLACVLYEALTGLPPFRGNSMAQQVAAHLNTAPPRATTTQPTLSPEIDAVIATGMAKDPNNRYATTIELADAASNAITDRIPSRTPHPAPPPTPRHTGQASRSVSPPAVTKLRQAPPLGTWGPSHIQQPADPSTPEDVRPARAPVEPVLTPPRPKRRRGWLPAIIVTAAVVASCVIGVAGYHFLTQGNPSQGSTSQPAAYSSPPSTVNPARPAGALDGLLLSVDQINAAMSTSGMTSVGTMTAMPDNSFLLSDQTCLPLSAAIQAKVYEGSRYSAMRAQVFAKSQQSAVDQGVVLFPTPNDAGSFFASSTRSWAACANRQFTLSANGSSQVQTVGPVSNTNGTLSATVTPANSFGVCERALTIANDVVIDIATCGGPTGAAVNIAHQIAAK
jgi:serine/threonine protein kinase